MSGPEAQATPAEAARNELRMFVAAEIHIARTNRKAIIDWKGFEVRLGKVVDAARTEVQP